MNIDRPVNRALSRTPQRAMALMVLALCVAGCDSGSDPPQTKAGIGAEVTASGSPAPPDSAHGAGAVRSETGTGALAHGTFRIEFSATGVSILADEVNEKEILSSLATRAGFEFTDAGAAWKVVTLNIDAGSVHAALVQLLKPHRYQIIYEYDNRRQTDALKRVVVRGTRAGQAMRNPVVKSGVTAEARTDRRRIARKPADDQQIYLNQLLDPSPRIRAEAAENIEASGSALDYLTQLLLSDPSPEVRAAATHSLRYSEDPKAVDALSTALDDADITVLVEVIDALGFAGDKRTISRLQPFLQHPDEDVRDAAESAIELLE